MSAEHPDRGRPDDPNDTAGPAGSPPSTPASGPAARGPVRFRLRRVVRLVAAGALLLALFAARSTSTYLQLTPGPANQLVGQVTGAVRNPDVCDPSAAGCRHGALFYTTVRGTPLSWLAVGERRLFGGPGEMLPNLGSAADQTTAELTQMAEAKASAAAVAWRLVFGQVRGHGAGAQVLGVTPGSAAAAAGLVAGDVVESVRLPGTRAAVPVPDAPTLARLVAHRAGTVVLGLRRAATRLPVAVPLDGSLHPLGVQLGTNVVGAPELSVQTGSVGGPSAGLMLTLAFVDALGRGDVTGGRSVAGTGTVALDGTVGPISGVAEKVVGARSVGATVFFAPVSEAPAAQAAAPAGLLVVPVATVGDALGWLCRHGATSPVCATTSAAPPAA